MNRRIKQPSIASGLLAALAILAVAASLAALGATNPKAEAKVASDAPPAQAPSANWNFEKGDFTGWSTRSAGSGAWYVYADGTKPPNPADTDPQFPFKVPAPPEGRYAAVTDMSAPGSRILHRTVKLDGHVKLRFTLFYENHVGRFSSPASLDHELRRANQQFRVEILKPAAPVDSLAAKDVLATVFRTAPGDRAKLGPRTMSFDLSRWAGDTVRLRFAQVDNQGPLRAGIDDVRLVQVGS